MTVRTYEIQGCYSGNWETIPEGEFDNLDAAEAAMRELENEHGWRGLRIVETSGEFVDVIIEGLPKNENDE